MHGGTCMENKLQTLAYYHMINLLHYGTAEFGNIHCGFVTTTGPFHMIFFMNILIA